MPPGSGVALLPRVFVRPRFNIRSTVDFARRIGKYCLRCLRYCRISLRGGAICRLIRVIRWFDDFALIWLLPYGRSARGRQTGRGPSVSRPVKAPDMKALYTRSEVIRHGCRWRRKRGPKWRRSGPLPREQFGVSLSLFSEG